MTDSIDYSRPVGWWCPVCGASGKQVGSALHDELLVHGIVRCCTSGAADEMCFAIAIPVYLPIPEGRRPLVEDEVTTGEAEVVTLNDRQLPAESIWYASNETTMADLGLAGIRDGLAVPINVHLWDAPKWQAYLTTEINRIAQASARARTVTGTTE